MYDKFQTLATRASIAVAILGNSDVTDIEMLPIQPCSLSDEKIHELTQVWAPRGLQFIGMAGVVDGQPKWALAIPLDELRAAALGDAFAVYCANALPGHVEKQRKGDEVDWLRGLWSLPDTRPN